MGIPVFLALLHMATIQGDIQTNYLLKYYMFFIFGAGLAAYIYGTLLGRFLSKKYRYIVSDIITKEGINLITLKPEGAAIKKYTPGQFVFVKFHSLGIPNEFHPFSLTSSPNENFLSLAIKSSGDYTETIKLLKKGSVAIVDGAYGGFSYLHSPRKRQIWVAGGIGITPFVSMAKDLKEKEEYNVKLYYTVSEKNEAVFAETLEKIDKECENFELVLWITKTQGRITANQIMQDEKDHKGIDIFICGPTKMMKDLRRQFNSLGIRNSHIFSEEFSLN
jgi:predicted ferric reductase